MRINPIGRYVITYTAAINNRFFFFEWEGQGHVMTIYLTIM